MIAIENNQSSQKEIINLRIVYKEFIGGKCIWSIKEIYIYS